MTKRINVLQFICPTGFYGAERWVIALANHLDTDHVRCDLAVTVEPGMPELEIVNCFSTLQGNSYKLRMSHSFDITIIRQLCELIREREIDIIHTHGYKSDILGIIAAKLTNTKSISTPHGFENAEDKKLNLYIKLGCWSLKYFDQVVPLSKQLYSDVVNAGVLPHKVTYIQNGVDLSEVEEVRKSNPKKNTREDTDQKRIGFIGQMIGRKNITDIIDIYDQLSRKHDNLRLLLLGDGDERERLEGYVKEISSRNQIEFLGFRDDRLDLLKTFDIFVMASTLEGIPRCLMEAMAMGIPVAAYDIPGVDQLIEHEVTGLLSPLGDKFQLMQCWESILFDEKLGDQLAKNAQKYVQTHYSAQRMAAQYVELYKSSLLI